MRPSLPPARQPPPTHSHVASTAPIAVPLATSPLPPLLGGRKRIFAVSDLHTDYAANYAWCKAISSKEHRQDILIVAGDVCDGLELLADTLGVLSRRFGKVFYCVGNHELWVRSADRAADSLEKFGAVMDICSRLGVSTAPERFNNALWVAPMHSWHHKEFDQEQDIPGVPAASAWTIADYAACRWPADIAGGEEQGGNELARWFDALNDSAAHEQMLKTRGETDIVSFSHFLPHHSLLPEKRFLYFPNLVKASGSLPLGERLAALKPDIHVFGHSHFAWDATLEGTRFIQAPLASPAERERRLRTLCFDAVATEDAFSNPVAARWLPLQIYRSDTGAALCQEVKPDPSAESDLSAKDAAHSVSEEKAACLARNDLSLLPSKDRRLEEVAAATHGIRGGEQTLEDEPPRHSCAETVQGEGAKSWQALRHGKTPPPLGAHWSDYYAGNRRTPEVTTLAPWVAKLYHRRRKESPPTAEKT